jgi:hypothetical protein
MYNEITRCRICKKESLLNTLSLGQQYLTGVFPRGKNEIITKGPMDLAWCTNCGLLQLKQSYSLEEMYGDNYGYRSGLNAYMVRHLTNKIKTLENTSGIVNGETVIDIGSNDATSLKAYKGKYRKIGVDPTGSKFREYYTDDIELLPYFFNRDIFSNHNNIKAKIITSIAMFYDLEDPASFVKDIEYVLDKNGIWHFEQSYMPSMLRTNSYDTVCHEHLEFYSFKVIKNLLEDNELRVIDVQMNAINGGSFAVTACKKDADFHPNMPIIEWMLKQEDDMKLHTPAPYRNFEEKVFIHRRNLTDLINALVNDGKKIIGYGASTKGNVLIQFCGLTTKHIPCIADVNEHKFGCFTPGSNIPIISEIEARAMKPDYFLVFPWHFKYSIIEREQEFISRGGKFIFPLPEIEIV